MLSVVLPFERRAVAAFSACMVLIGGVRFSDGSVLRAIAAGMTPADGSFPTAASQYVWDAPLKVLLLSLLPAQIVVIAAVFLLLALLPLLGLWAARSGTMFALSAVCLTLTPALRLSLQNVGVGDGLVVCAVIVLCAARSVAVRLAALVTIGAWHPQQGLLIILSYAVAEGLVSARGCDAALRTSWLVAAGAGVITGGIFLAYRALLGFEYAGRLEYMVSQGSSFIPRNLAFAPIALAFALPWSVSVLQTPALRSRGKRGLYFVWLALASVVALLTTDVTRVLCLLTLPVLLTTARSRLEAQTDTPGGVPLRLALPALFFPAFSWSGLDLFLWQDLFRDLCKYGVICF